MNIGEMNKKVTIQSRVLVRDSGGGYVKTWSDVATVWASVQPSSASKLNPSFASETTRGMQEQQEMSLTVIMRDRALDKTQRLIYKGRVLEIHAVTEVNEAGRFLKIKCQEFST